MREIISLNNGWTLIKEQETSIVNIPHCFNNLDGQGNGKMFRGDVFYVKKINLKDIADKEIYLEIGAAANMSELFINENSVGKSNCGFSMLRYDITKYLINGDNEIKVLVSNKLSQNLYPAMADFSFYGGLYRDVNLIIDSDVHFDELDKSRDGFNAETFINDKNGIIKVEPRIINRNHKNIFINFLLKNKEGNVILNTNKSVQESYEFTIENIHLWQGVDDPYLYSLTISLIENNILYDQRTIKIGFRKVEFDKDIGFLLNGVAYKIKGVGRHQDLWLKGNAISKEDIKNDLNIILQMGANSIRATHYQHSDDFYSLCDELGILVWAEIPVISAVTQNEFSDENAKDQLTYLISQVRNHTCVYCYGVQNEVCMVTKCEYSFNLVKKLADLAKKLDPTRFTAQANEYTTEENCIINSYTDIIGYNLYYGWYYGNMNDLASRLDSIHKSFPDKPIMLTEYGVDTNPLIHSSNPQKKDYSEEYQVEYVKNALSIIEKRNWLAGSYAWVMFDFGSASRDEGGKKGLNQKGLVTIDRKVIKDAYYIYKANWSKELFVHIAGKRYYNRAEEETSILVMSNIPEITLKGQNFEKKEKTINGIARFDDVKLNLGLNRFEVYGKNFDKVYTSYILINRVCEPDKTYVIEKKEDRNNAVNWFEKVDVEKLVSLDKPLRPEGFSLDDRICDIFSKKKAKEVFMKYFSFFTESSRFDENSPITLKKILDFAHVDIPEDIKKKINSEFNLIDK